jgi:hypothetical protein
VLLAGNESTANGYSWSANYDGHGGADVFDPAPAVATAATIAAAASLTIDTVSAETVSFAEGTGTLVLNDPSGFTGQITGFTGTAPDAAHSDVIDLVGINYNSSQFAETYNSTTGVLTVTDGTHSASITFDDFNGTFDLASDGNGGTDIFDPPATGSNDQPDNGTSPANTADTTQRDAPHDWGAQFADETNAQTQGQSDAGHGGEKLVGMTGDDNFVFHENLGAQNPSQNQNLIAEELHDHPSVQTAQQLVELTTPENHAPIADLVHQDGGPHETSPAPWHANTANSFHLH